MSNSLPITSTPRDVKILRDGNGSLKQIRVYGVDGNPFVNIDFGHDHRQGDPHYHPWDSPIQGSPTSNNRHVGLPISLQLGINFLWKKRDGHFHDGILTQIIQKNEDIILNITDINNVQKIITLKTCIHNSVKDKGKGIIYELTIAKGGNWRQTLKSATDDKKLLWKLTHLKSFHSKRKDIEDQIMNGDLSLVMLFPSYGPEVIALCEEVIGIDN